MPEQFVTCNVEEIRVGEILPCTLYLYLDFRFITFRAKGDSVDRQAYDRLEFRKIKNLFVAKDDEKAFHEWGGELKKEVAPELAPEHSEFKKMRDYVHRKTLDIFQSDNPDKIIAATVSSSKKLVAEVMKFPFAVQTLRQLQEYSRGTVDHSVNVSVLSVYLAMQMGYSHAVILQHIGMGGLLHDIGKPKVPINDTDTPADIKIKMRDHALLGMRILDEMPRVPEAVKMIVAQHHEQYDGSGFPKKLRGSFIYDLAKIVAIANVFDELVGDGRGTLAQRQCMALQQMDQLHYRKFDPQKFEKAMKILKMGI